MVKEYMMLSNVDEWTSSYAGASTHKPSRYNEVLVHRGDSTITGLQGDGCSSE